MSAEPRQRVALITCDVLRDEFAALTATRPHVVHVELMQQGLHNTPQILQQTLRDTVRALEQKINCAAIVLGYGLCSRGIENVSTQRALLVVPRAHDCITLLLGSKERYARYVAEHPGCYWYSPGWNRCHTPPGPERYEKLREQYAQKYDPDDVDFLMENEQHWFKAYNRATYVDIGIGATPQDIAYTQRCAQWLGWDFDRQQGDPALLCELLDGPWHAERFLVLQPGQTATMTADESVIRAIGLPDQRTIPV